MASRPTIIFFATALCCGCSVQQLASKVAHRDVLMQTVNFNDALSITANQMLLLNILRAKDREPMHFAALTAQHGEIAYSVSTGLSIPFGGDADDAFSILPSGSLESSPSFDVVPLNSSNFYRGILGPLPADIIRYYLDQGWPTELLLNLLVRRIEFNPAQQQLLGLKKPVFVSDPMAPERFLEFQQLLSQAELNSTEEMQCYGSLLDQASLGDVSKLVAAKGAGFVVVPAIRDGTAIRPGRSDEVSTGYCLAQKETILTFRFSPPRPADTPQVTNAPANEVVLQSDTALPDAPGSVAVRSPEGILYFLGEIVRAQEVNGHQYVTVGDKSCQENLFVVNAVAKSQPYQLEVVHHGKIYGVPADQSSNPLNAESLECDKSEGGRTMHVLSLVTQLVGLFQSREDLPVSPTVRVVN
jgi:hypothetical protein